MQSEASGRALLAEPSFTNACVNVTGAFLYTSPRLLVGMGRSSSRIRASKATCQVFAIGRNAIFLRQFFASYPAKHNILANIRGIYGGHAHVTSTDMIASCLLVRLSGIKANQEPSALPRRLRALTSYRLARGLALP